MSSLTVSEPMGAGESLVVESNGAVILLEDVGVRYRIASERVITFKEYIIRRFQGKIALGDFWHCARLI